MALGRSSGCGIPPASTGRGAARPASRTHHSRRPLRTLLAGRGDRRVARVASRNAHSAYFRTAANVAPRPSFRRCSRLTTVPLRHGHKTRPRQHLGPPDEDPEVTSSNATRHRAQRTQRVLQPFAYIHDVRLNQRRPRQRSHLIAVQFATIAYSKSPGTLAHARRSSTDWLVIPRTISTRCWGLSDNIATRFAGGSSSSPVVSFGPGDRCVPTLRAGLGYASERRNLSSSVSQPR